MKSHPELRGTVTDLLIGDLFDDRVDAVWGPMESLYPAGKQPPVGWNGGQADPSPAGPKQNELVLPSGPTP
jgi:hypothetical protein